jgi:hypothetical protein
VASFRASLADDRGVALEPASAARELDWALPFADGWDDVGLRRDLLDLCFELDVQSGAAEQRSTRELREIVIGAAARGELTVIRQELLPAMAAPASTTKPMIAAAHASSIATEPEAWIEISLVDDSDAPYVGRVELELADGARVTRSANEFGLLRLDGIAAGSCKVRLLDVDASACEAA